MINFLVTSLLNQENDVIFFQKEGNRETETTTQHTLPCFFLNVSAWIGGESEAGLQQRKQSDVDGNVKPTDSWVAILFLLY